MKYLSVCSGIEAASVAFKPLGWEPLAFSEIEPFPRAVLQHHHPDVPLHGDFTELKEQTWIVDADVLCGGTPCQAFSVAGLRNSLSDDRGNLTLQFIHLADAIDALRSTAGRQPAWILWENVPGVLSTKDNAFGAFLGGLCGRDAAIPEPQDGWSGSGVVDGPQRVAAWRTLDAQFFGLAQRRKRVFVLALGGAGKWACADALLPITESLRGDTAPRREKRQGVAAATGESASGGGGLGTEGGVIQSQYEHVPLCADTVTSKFAKGAEALQHGAQDGGNCIPIVMAHGQANAEVVSDGEPSLTCNHEAPILMRMREGKEGGGKGPLVSEDQSLTLATANDQVLARPIAWDEELNPTEDMAGTLTRGGDGGRHAGVMRGMQVRRLTPMECCRLQGFPDDYLDITYRGKSAADGNKYKALGNSWAVPVVAWIGRRIELVRSRQ